MQKISALIVLLILVIVGFSFSVGSQELTRELFQTSSLVSSEIARKQIQKIYQTSGKQRTFHCGCVFDNLKQVFPNLCEANSSYIVSEADPRKLTWVSLMPPHIFAKSLKCWNTPVCAQSDGAKCCSQVSPKFKSMQSDMHNIFPMIENSSPSIDENIFAGLWEYSYCGIADTPRKEIRGEASRAYLYMSFLYKIPLKENLENSLRKWHFEDPPGEWEEKRNDLIEVVQGNRNPFIDQPELVERVSDF